MIDYKAEVTINVPAERIFRALGDPSKYDAWTDMTGTRAVSGTTMDRVGAQMETVVGEGPLKQRMVFEVTALEPNKRVAFTSVSKGSMHWDSEVSLEPQGASSTRVVQAGQIRLSGVAKLMEGLMSGEVRKAEQKELEKLKMLLESNQL